MREREKNKPFFLNELFLLINCRLAFLPIYFTANEAGRHQVSSNNSGSLFISLIFLIKIHISTLCITISLCATVALACLFSPKVYIILLHPEKNMRLTKQLKAQVNSIKFASQIATTTDFMSNHHPSPNRETIPSAVLTSTNTEETKQPLILPPKVIFPDPMNKFDNHQRKIPTVITTSQSDGYLNHEKKRLAIKRYDYIADDDDDDDSLNSNIFHDEQIML